MKHYPSLTGKVLWEKLSKLTTLGFVRKVDYYSFPRHTEYRLTEQGREIAIGTKALMGKRLKHR
ncbi:MAG: winged helix-turn-helix transcriptional regulator [Candidatus Fervidibacter sp.]|uniref:winged helix-turn-helix transcriptional regulator n=1 Tax=Candidatus Fervidibacter sp. TaxID=3100871 RepID=UPI00404911E9